MNKPSQSIDKHHMRYNIVVLSAILAVFLVITMLQAYFTWTSINDELQNREKMEVNVQNEKIDALKKSVADIVDSSAPAFEQKLDDVEQIKALLLSMVRQNEDLLGATVAFAPDYHPENGRLYAPYVYRMDGNIHTKMLSYDYTQFDWYAVPYKEDKSGWCAPYADQDGTYLLMSTYSVVLHDVSGKKAAILTSDLPMSELSYVTDVIYRKSSLRSIIILSMQIFGILLILFIVWRAVAGMRKMEVIHKENEAISGELSIASELQRAILPTEYPKHDHLDIHASLTPASQVSGDFYDFILHDDKLYFCIGDVSTQGLGAALAMLITRTAYRTTVNRHEQLSVIMNEMNQSLVAINEQHMYATFFAGLLDLSTGRLTYCNAGHLHPYLLSDGEAEQIDISANVPLGITDWDFETQEMQLKHGSTLFLYTDGIIEALNQQQGAFGEKRLALHLRKIAEKDVKPHAVVKHIKTAVSHHLGVDSTAADDLTMLSISYV